MKFLIVQIIFLQHFKLKLFINWNKIYKSKKKRKRNTNTNLDSLTTGKTAKNLSSRFLNKAESMFTMDLESMLNNLNQYCTMI